MSATLEFDPIRLPPECEALRAEVRAFLAEEIAAGTFDPSATGGRRAFNRELSRKIGARGWLGMTWPAPYGRSTSALERYVVIEELLAAGVDLLLDVEIPEDEQFWHDHHEVATVRSGEGGSPTVDLVPTNSVTEQITGDVFAVP